MTDFALVEGELVPIDVNGNPLPVQDGAVIGTTPGIIIAGKNGANASFVDVGQVDGFNALKVDGGPTSFKEYNTTLFGSLKTANPFTLGDFNFKYGIEAREFGTSIATGGTVTHQTNPGTARLAVTASNGSRARLRTHTFFRYQSGKVQWIKISGYHSDEGVANQTRRWGGYDDNDGLFFELNNLSLRVVRRSSVSGTPVDDPTERANWTGDKLDGSGPSGVNLDLTKGNLFEITYQWLGVGKVQFFINGIMVHTMNLPNTINAPYMRTGQLPLQWEVVNTGASTAASMDVVCASVLSMGGDKVPTTAFSAFNTTDKSVTTTEIPVLSIRPKLTYNSFENRMLLLPYLGSIRTEGVRLGYRLIMNATLTGASFNSVNAASGAEFDTTATAFTGGETLFQGFLPNSNDREVFSLLEMFSILGRKLRRDGFAASVDTFTIVAVTEAAGTSNVRASISWYEVRL